MAAKYFPLCFLRQQLYFNGISVVPVFSNKFNLKINNSRYLFLIEVPPFTVYR